VIGKGDKRVAKKTNPPAFKGRGLSFQQDAPLRLCQGILIYLFIDILRNIYWYQPPFA
jgi:hypothetical protein